MIIRRVSEQVVTEAARGVGVRLVVFRGGNYVLKPIGRRYRNDLGNMCIHGYRALMAAVMEADAGAYIETSLASYRGRDEWEAKSDEHLVLAQSMFKEACTCVDGEPPHLEEEEAVA